MLFLLITFYLVVVNKAPCDTIEFVWWGGLHGHFHAQTIYGGEVVLCCVVVLFVWVVTIIQILILDEGNGRLVSYPTILCAHIFDLMSHIEVWGFWR